MKKVIIIIRPDKYFETKDALIASGFTSFSQKLVYGRGRQSVDFSIAAEENNSDNDIMEYPLVAKKEITIILRDEDLKTLVQTVFCINSTGHSGDGKIFVLPVENAIRIRTNEQSENALM